MLDQHTVGWGASGRNGGMATTGLAIGLGKAIKRYGRHQAIEMFAEYNRAIDTIEELVKEHSIDCDFQRSGKLTLAMNAKQVGQMRKTQQTLADAGRLLGRPSSTSRTSTARSAATSTPAAWWTRSGAGVHVGKFAHGLAEAGRPAPASRCARTPRSPSWPPARAAATRCTRPAAPIHADQVLIATSGYTGSLTPWLRRRTIPVGSFIIVTEPLPLETVAADPAPPPAGLRQQDAHLLLPDHAGQPAALRRTGQVRAVEPRLGPQERGDPQAAR